MKNLAGKSWGRAGILLLLGLVVLGGFYARTFQFRELPPEWGEILDPDAAYHLRLTRAIEAYYPSVPSRDPYLSFPSGSYVSWPPLHDFAAASFHLALGGERILPLERFAFYWPAAEGALSLVLIFLLAQALGLGSWSSLLASALVSLVPVHLSFTLGGRFDHHSTDLLLTLLFLIVLLRVWKRADCAHGALAGVASLTLAVVLLFLNWIGSIIYLVPLVATAILAGIGGKKKDQRTVPFLFRMGWSLLAGGFALGALFLAFYGTEGMSLSLQRPSFFQPLTCLGAGGLVLLWGFLIKGGERWTSPPILALVLGTSLVLVLGAGAALRGFRFYYGEVSSPLARIGEFRSPFLIKGLLGGGQFFSLRGGAGYLTWGFLLFPAILAMVFRKGFNRGEGSGFPALLLGAWGTVSWVLALTQYRFGLMFSVPLGVGVAWMGGKAGAFLRGGRSLRLRFLGLFLLLAILLSWSPGALLLLDKAKYPAVGLLAPELLPMVQALKQLTPAPSPPFDLAKTPEYGVLADWSVGNLIATEGERPVLATNWLHSLEGGEENFWASMRFFLTTDPEEAAREMKSRRLRYLFLNDPLNTTIQSLDVLGPRERFLEVMEDPLGTLAQPGQASPFALGLSLSRGSDVPGGSGVALSGGRFRLIWEGDLYRSPKNPRRGQIFELVEGAGLTGNTAPGSRVQASLDLQTGDGIRFRYQEAGKAGGDGGFRLRVPFSTLDANGSVRALGAWQVRADPGGMTGEAIVTESQVREGADVTVLLR